MINNYYQIYLNKVLTLAETIVIKSIDSVNGLNQFVNDQAQIAGTPPVNMSNPKGWKYYLNVSGEYHYLDTPMHIISLDTLQQIEFNKENLKIHLATAKGYQYGTREYRLLVNQYPQQEMLIKGILYPVDIDKAIAAREGEILGYPSYLVEENEYSLMSRLQKWIDGYKIRWVNQQFGVSDSLYPATSLGIMYLNLVPTIMNLRLEACKTNEAHSYHVHQYLESHGLLDESVVNMTKKQALFFYRNIAYIERNSGQRETFDWLVQHVMTERNLPIAEYVMKHDTTNQLSTLQPELYFNKRPLNNFYGTEKGSNFTLDQLLAKQDAVVSGNTDYRIHEAPAIRETMQNSLSNTVLTKVLESSIIDETNSSPYSFVETLFNHWMYLSSVDVYRAFVNVKNPKTGEAIALSANEAFIMAWYTYCNSIGINSPTIPKVLAKHVQRIVPTAPNHNGIVSNVVGIDDLMSIVDAASVPRTTAIQAISMQPNIEVIISTQAFYDLCVKIYNASQMQRNLTALQETNIGRSMTHALVSRIYSDNVCTFAPDNTTYADWFSARNIDIAGLSNAELGTLYLELVNQATGLALNTSTSLATLQRAMIGVMKQLSSYTVQFISDINTSAVQKTDWTAPRADNLGYKGIQHEFVSNMSSDINTADGLPKMTLSDIVDFGSRVTFIDSLEKAAITMDLGKFFEGASLTNKLRLFVNVANVGVNNDYPAINVPKDLPPVIGIETFAALSNTQKQMLKDVYGTQAVIQ